MRPAGLRLGTRICTSTSVGRAPTPPEAKQSSRRPLPSESSRPIWTGLVDRLGTQTMLKVQILANAESSCLGKSQKRSFSNAPTRPLLVVLPAVENMESDPLHGHECRDESIDVPHMEQHGYNRRHKKCGAPWDPGRFEAKNSTGGTSVTISASEMGKLRRRATDIVTSITEMVAQLLFITVPKTIETSAISRGKPNSDSAEQDSSPAFRRIPPCRIPWATPPHSTKRSASRSVSTRASRLWPG